jgi:hypothetical protein
VPQLAPHELERLLGAIRGQDHLCRLVDEIERLHRVVFHANERADWGLVRASAEQILVAHIMIQRQGDIEGVFFALRALEDAGKNWDAALAEVAAATHSYFTTPLGVVMRQDLFGRAAVFITPDAHEWVQSLRAPGASGGGA